jgi:hypothetical protein
MTRDEFIQIVSETFPDAVDHDFAEELDDWGDWGCELWIESSRFYIHYDMTGKEFIVILTSGDDEPLCEEALDMKAKLNNRTRT